MTKVVGTFRIPKRCPLTPRKLVAKRVGLVRKLEFLVNLSRNSLWEFQNSWAFWGLGGIFRNSSLGILFGNSSLENSRIPKKITKKI